MFLPVLSSGIEKRNHLIVVWVDSGQVRPFEEVAPQTGKCEVGDGVIAAMFARPNVIDRKSLVVSRLRQMAILASAFRAELHKLAGLFVHAVWSSGR